MNAQHRVAEPPAPWRFSAGNAGGNTGGDLPDLNIWLALVVAEQLADTETPLKTLLPA